MDIPDAWEKALKNTEIIRSRIQALLTFTDTSVPYIFLAESSVNIDDTMVRRGEIIVKKPSIVLPPHSPHFEGFNFDAETRFNEEVLMNFLLVRGIVLPSLNYNNKIHSLDIYEGKISRAIEHYADQLQRAEDVHTGLIRGPEDCWQFSLLIFVCAQVIKNADTDIKKLLDEFRNKGIH